MVERRGETYGLAPSAAGLNRLATLRKVFDADVVLQDVALRALHRKERNRVRGGQHLVRANSDRAGGPRARSASELQELTSQTFSSSLYSFPPVEQSGTF
jgi:hypothetical protein